MATTLSFAAIAAFLWAAVSDVASRRIANRLVLVLAALGLARIVLALAAGGGIGAAAADLCAGFGVLAAGAMLHHFRLVGGGDVKLLAAGTLWLGAGALAAFLSATALAGGALALGFVGWRALRPGAARASLPYGVAIAFAGVLGTLALG